MTDAWRWTDEGYVEVRDPRIGGAWWNYLFNDHTYIRVDGFGNGVSFAREPRIQQWGRGRRELWVRFGDDGATWCPTGSPIPKPGAQWRAIHAPCWTRIEAQWRDLVVYWQAMVPRVGQREVWTVGLINRGRCAQLVSVTTALFQPEAGVMGSQGYWDADRGLLLRHDFPHHAAWADYYDLADQANWLFVAPSSVPHRWAACDRDFLGTNPPGAVPAGVTDGLPSRPAALEPSCAALQYDVELAVGETWELSLIAGAVTNPDNAPVADLLGAGAIEQEIEALEGAWRGEERRLLISTPDPDLDRFVNRWWKKELLWETRLWRNGISTPWRNELQDAMGYATFNPEAARHYLRTVTAAQTRDGHLQVWNTRAGEKPNHPLVNFRHNDGGIWLIICWCVSVHQAGDITWLSEHMPFADGDTAPLIEHLRRALEERFADRGEHGLLRMHDGDWTDPMNGPGRRGTGGSGWATMALAYAAQLLAPLAEAYGNDPLAKRCSDIADELNATTRDQLWAGDRFAYGIDDDGRRFGDATDRRVWLNPQSWGILSGSATLEQAHACATAVDAHLSTRCGPRILSPPFHGWDPQVGRLSLKVPGGTENGSIYCHAAAFWAAAQAVMGNVDGAYDTLRRVLPTNPDNPVEHSGQPPFWQHNAWFGDQDHPSFGRSSGTLGTGTVAWGMLVAVEHILGVRATVSGLVLTPNLPRSWTHVQIERMVRGCRYHVEIRVDLPPESPAKVVVDGELLPPDRDNPIRVPWRDSDSCNILLQLPREWER
ncbi:MAG: GH36-type glycosyl hydrolase domain-containing protein [Alkalispirochaeta sp.]